MLKPQSYAWGIDAGYAREPALLALLAARGIPAPANAEAVLGDDGRLAAIAYDYIEGVTVSALGRAARATLAREVGATLTALHATPVAEARALGVQELDLGEEIYRPMVEACLPHLGPRGRGWLERRFASFIEGGGSLAAPRVLAHADLGCAHVLAAPDGRLAGVIDWGDALIADPAYDLAALLAECPRGFAERVIDAYEGPASRDPRHAPPRRVLRRCAADLAGVLRRRHRRRGGAPCGRAPHRRAGGCCGAGRERRRAIDVSPPRATLRPRTRGAAWPRSTSSYWRATASGPR